MQYLIIGFVYFVSFPFVHDYWNGYLKKKVEQYNKNKEDK